MYKKGDDFAHNSNSSFLEKYKIPLGIPMKPYFANDDSVIRPPHVMPGRLLRLPGDCWRLGAAPSKVKNVAVCCQESASDALNLEDLAEMLGESGCECSGCGFEHLS